MSASLSLYHFMLKHLVTTHKFGFWCEYVDLECRNANHVKRPLFRRRPSCWHWQQLIFIWISISAETPLFATIKAEILYILYPTCYQFKKGSFYNWGFPFCSVISEKKTIEYLKGCNVLVLDCWTLTAQSPAAPLPQLLPLFSQQSTPGPAKKT